MTIGGRATRAGSLALLGADLARHRVVSAEDYSGIIRRLGTLHGLPQKLGQILGMRELQEEGAGFRRLCHAGATQPMEVVRDCIERELGAPLELIFSHFAEEGIAASLGQVHRATLRQSGAEVAVKVQYPGIEDSVETDLAALGWLARPLSAHQEGFNLDAYRTELREAILAELDYEREALTLSRFQSYSRALEQLKVPVPLREFSSRRVLTMEWIDGALFEETLSWSEDERKKVAEGLIRLFLLSLLRWRELHADPHPGNYRFLRPGTKIVLLDLGCCKRIERSTSDGVRRIIEHSTSLGPTEALDVLLALGFDAQLLEPMRSLLPGALNILCEPFLTAGPFDVRGWNLGAKLSQHLGDHRWNFRYAGPAEMLLLMRSLSGLIQYLAALNAPVSWQYCYNQCIEGLPAMAQYMTTESSSGPAEPVYHAKELCIRVEEDSQLKAQITLRVSAINSLKEFIPPEVVSQLDKKRINVDQLTAAAIAKQCPIGELFSLEEERKKIRVWLQ